jgi:hypothetical protein
MAKHIYLAKESDDLVSHCRCENAMVGFPGQLDCPWCGCGWLFSCHQCRKAFTFAKGIETDEPWKSLARRDIQAIGRAEPNDIEIQEWVNGMQTLLADVEPGKTYVSFDGHFIPTDVSSLSLDGWFAHHDLDFLPQIAALQDPRVIDNILANKTYWLSNRLPDDSSG